MVPSGRIRITVDRPFGSRHPQYHEMIYPINYGFIPGLKAPDGEEQDVYILGPQEPLAQFEGFIIAVIHRRDDCEDKWVAASARGQYSEEEIRSFTWFMERYFDSWIEMI